MFYRYLFVFVFLLAIYSAHAQQFDHRNGYIFDQPYVTRISEEQARQRLQRAEVNSTFLELHARHGKTEVLPNGVKRVANNLIFSAPNHTALQLKTYVFKGKSDAGDSQRFVYLKTEANYHIVCVEFDHDAPGFLLIDKASLQVFFVNH